MKKTAEENLNLAAREFSLAVLKMCKKLTSRNEGEPDPKLLKEAGSALKEAVSVVTALGKKDITEDQGIRIVFDMADEFAE